MSPTKQKKSKFNKGELDMTIPSSDAKENEISVPNLNLAPNGK